MKQLGIIAALVVLIVTSLALSAGAMRDEGALATCLGLATTSTGITTHNGSDIQRAKVVYAPSTFYGFSSKTYIYVEASDGKEADKVASQIMGYRIKNLVARVYEAGTTLNTGNLKVSLDGEVTTGAEGSSDSRSSSNSSSYGSSSRRGSYHTSDSSDISSSSSMDATAVYAQYEFSLKVKAEDGKMDTINVPDIPIGGSDSAMTNQRSSDSSSSSRDYYSSSPRRGGYSGGSSHYSSSSNTSSMYRSPEIEQKMMKDKIARGSNRNIAALIVDAITMAALSDQIPGAIFETKARQNTNTPAPQGQNISAPLR